MANLPEKWGLAKTQCCMVTDVIFGDNEDSAPLAYLYRDIAATSE